MASTQQYINIKILGRCWETNLEHINANAKMVLLALASKADDYGVCYPGYDTLAKMCSISRRSAIRAVEHLEQEGYVIKMGQGGRNISNVYFVTIKLSQEEIARTVREHPRLVEAQNRLNGDNPVTVSEEDNSSIYTQNGDNPVTVSCNNGDYPVTVSEPERVTNEAERVTGLAQKGDNPVTQINNNNHELKDSLRESPETPPPQPPPPIPETSNSKITKDHPAIQTFKSTAKRFPNKGTWELIATTVGENPLDLDFFREVIVNYIAVGWNPLNVKGMLDFFSRRELPDTRPKQGGNNRVKSKSAEPAAYTFNPRTGDLIPVH